MPNNSTQHLHLSAIGLPPTIIEPLHIQLQERGVIVQMHAYHTLPDLIRGMMTTLPHVVLFHATTPSSDLEAALAFTERTFPDLPRLLLAQDAHKSTWSGQSVLPWSPSSVQEVVDTILAMALGPADGNQRARRTRIMQQIEKSLHALANIEQQLGASNIPAELHASRQYLQQLQRELRNL